MRNILKGGWATATTLATTLLLVGFSVPVLADGISKSNVHHFWDPNAVVGQSVLYRSDDGLKASFKINAGATNNNQALTLWFMVFNNPEGCATSPCSPADVGSPSAEGDFLYGGGTISTDKKAHFGGSLEKGDNTGSGFIELELDFLALGLTDPWGAEVMLAIHSHGTASSGNVLKDQLSSFFGGCLFFLGPDGFAGSPSDVPDKFGDCSTVMYSIHQP